MAHIPIDPVKDTYDEVTSFFASLLAAHHISDIKPWQAHSPDIRKNTVITVSTLMNEKYGYCNFDTYDQLEGFFAKWVNRRWTKLIKSTNRNKNDHSNDAKFHKGRESTKIPEILIEEVVEHDEIDDKDQNDMQYGIVESKRRKGKNKKIDKYASTRITNNTQNKVNNDRNNANNTDINITSKKQNQSPSRDENIKDQDVGINPNSQHEEKIEAIMWKEKLEEVTGEEWMIVMDGQGQKKVVKQRLWSEL